MLHLPCSADNCAFPADLSSVEELLPENELIKSLVVAYNQILTGYCGFKICFL